MTHRPVLSFIIMTFAVTLAAGLAAFHVGGEETFESPAALPLLLIAIWSPNFAAAAIRWRQGRLRELLEPLRRTGGSFAWVVALSPLAVAAGVAIPGDPSSVPVGTLVVLLAMNLMMGPVGEELGWRGFLLPELQARFGWTASAGGVGVIWAAWHAPLWFMPSPHAAIPFWVFASTVMAFSYLMTAAYRASSGALMPVIGFHLAANVGVGYLELSGVATAAEAYRTAMPVYVVLALLAWRWSTATNVEIA